MGVLSELYKRAYSLAPLVPATFFVCSGYVLAHVVFGFSDIYILLASFASLAALFAILSLCFHKKIFFYIAILLFASLYFTYSGKDAPQYFADYEDTITIRVKTLYSKNFGKTSGIGEVIKSDIKSTPKKLLFSVPECGDAIIVGSRFMAKGAVSFIDAKEGGFYRYLANNAVYAKFQTNQKIAVIRTLDNTSGKNFVADIYYNVLGYVKCFAGEKLENGVQKSNALGMYNAIVLGDSQYILKEQKKAFARSGAMHIFAISGLHVGVVAALLYAIFSFLRVGPSGRILASLPLLFVYVQICGAKPSAVRAFVMLAFVGLAFAFKRKGESMAAITASALLFLIICPRIIFDAGFCLSYMAAFSIILLGVPLSEWLYQNSKLYTYVSSDVKTPFQKLISALYKFFLVSLSISFAAFLGTCVASVGIFGYVSFASLINATIFVFGATLVVPVGVLSIILPSFIGQYLNIFACKMLAFMAKTAAVYADMPLYLAFQNASGYLSVLFGVLFLGSIIYLNKCRNIRLLLVPTFTIFLYLISVYVVQWTAIF